MDDEHKELLRFFFRKWSTQELTYEARQLLEEDVMQVKMLLEIDGVDTSLLDDATEARSREWFAKKYQELESR